MIYIPIDNASVISTPNGLCNRQCIVEMRKSRRGRAKRKNQWNFVIIFAVEIDEASPEEAELWTVAYAQSVLGAYMMY